MGKLTISKAIPTKMPMFVPWSFFVHRAILKDSVKIASWTNAIPDEDDHHPLRRSSECFLHIYTMREPPKKTS